MNLFMQALVLVILSSILTFFFLFTCQKLGRPRVLAELTHSHHRPGHGTRSMFAPGETSFASLVASQHVPTHPRQFLDLHLRQQHFLAPRHLYDNNLIIV